MKGLVPTGQFGKLSLYNSFALVDARYTTGEYKGLQVEYPPKYINRVGINYGIGKFSVNAQHSFKDSSFGDASNAKYAADGLIGIIPANSIFDLSSSYKLKRNCMLKFGINNLTDSRYFTLRTAEYPGPGIIPSIGRMFYAGITASF